jgi:succinate dehydrogenase / fumarate reductase iron-sulfur subunit
MNREYIFRVFRFDPSSGKRPAYRSYTVRIAPGMTVLDALHLIREEQDATIALRYSCRMGVCGSCGMMVNARPVLACSTQVADIADRVVTVAPLPNYPVIRDLVPDLTPLFEKHERLHPHLIPAAGEGSAGEKELLQTPEELVRYLQFAYCIKCGICLSACPTVATDPDYPGPMPLAQAYRYCADTRDRGREARLEAAAGAHGAFRCHFAGECSAACPKGVDPARAVQLLKRMLVLDYLKLLDEPVACRRRAVPSPSPSGPGPGTPVAPPFTVP